MERDKIAFRITDCKFKEKLFEKLALTLEQAMDIFRIKALTGYRYFQNKSSY